MADKTFAIMIDGGFFQKKFYKVKGRYPDAEETEKYCDQYRKIAYFQGFGLYRIFYYNSVPSRELKQNNPLDPSGRPYYAFSDSVVKSQEAIWKRLTEKPFFAMRQGTLKKNGWALGENVLRDIANKTRGENITHNDLKLITKQKQVDLKIGMDIAHLAFKCLVQKIIMITDDADLAPAAKLARVEGIQVFLDAMNENVPEELLKHTDVVLRSLIPG
jgi:uncharacterized LabA/DUF88 family protein